MTRAEAEAVASRLESLASSSDDGTTLGWNVATLLRDCTEQIRAEVEYLGQSTPKEAAQPREAMP